MITDLSKYKGKAIMLTNQEAQVENKFYRSQVVEIPISMDMFHSMGSGNYYPDKGLSNTIAHGSGIEFFSSMRMVDTYGDEVTDKDGNKLRKITGKECTKQGRKMKPDGSWFPGSPDPYEFNFIDRAELDCIGKNVSDINKRKKVLEYKKFATQRASTGASLAVIRELLGVNTSFSKAEIDLGLIVVSRIEKTSEFQEVLALADVEARRSGGDANQRIDDTARLLTGEVIDSTEDFNNNFSDSEEVETVNETEPETKSRPEPPPEKPAEKPTTLKEEFEALLISANVDTGASEYFTKIVSDREYTDEILNWAIGSINEGGQ